MAERKQRPGGARKDEVVTREYTINLHKRLHGWYSCGHLRTLASPVSPPNVISRSLLRTDLPCNLMVVDFGVGTNRLGGAGMCELAFPCD